MDLVKISMEALLQRATNPRNENIDTAAVEAFCALINKEKDGPQMGVKFLTTRMHSKNEQEALQTLHILDYCMQKCGAIFQDEIGKFRFLNEMIKLVSPKYLGCHTPHTVKQKILQLMYLWTLDYPKQSKIKDAYDMLKKQGVIRDVPLSVSADYTVERQNNTIFQDEEKGKLLKKLLQSKNPEDLQAANRLIKTMVKEDEKKAELKSKQISELESVQNNIRLLNEMLDSYKHGVSSQDETELIKELHESCVRMRLNMVALATETSQNDEILSEILKINDEVGLVFEKYQHVILSGKEITGKKDNTLSLLDLSSNSFAKSKDHPKSNVDMLCDILTSPLESECLEDVILKPTVSAFCGTKDTNGSMVGEQNKAKGFDDLDALSETLLLENLQSTKRIGNQFNKSFQGKIPMNLMQSKSAPQGNGSSILNQLTTMNQSANASIAIDKENKDKTTGSNRYTLDIDINKLMLDSAKHKPDQVHESQNKSTKLMNESQASELLNSSIDDLLVDITTTPTTTPSITPTLSRTISASSSASSSATGTSSSTIEKKENDEIEGQNGTITKNNKQVKLSDIFVDLKSIKPSNIEPIIALDEKNGITLTLHFARDKPHDDVSVLVVTIVSKNELPLKNVLFRAIVPKSCKLKLQPASASELPAYNPFLPPTAITQVMLIANMDKIVVSLKFIVSYIVDDETMTEMGEIEALPT